LGSLSVGPVSDGRALVLCVIGGGGGLLLLLLFLLEALKVLVKSKEGEGALDGGEWLSLLGMMPGN
jgi:hypothetical protein